jgi:DNA replication protein DnaC
MVIDDMSYVRCSELESSVMVELICHRYERKSLLVTSNQPFREWDNNFPNGSMTVAAVERLVHNCPHHRQQGRELPAKGSCCMDFQ